MIACRSEPAPLSAIVVTLKVAAFPAVVQKIAKSRMKELRCKERSLPDYSRTSHAVTTPRPDSHGAFVSSGRLGRRKAFPSLPCEERGIRYRERAGLTSPDSFRDLTWKFCFIFVLRRSAPRCGRRSGPNAWHRSRRIASARLWSEAGPNSSGAIPVAASLSDLPPAIRSSS